MSQVDRLTAAFQAIGADIATLQDVAAFRSAVPIRRRGSEVVEYVRTVGFSASGINPLWANVVALLHMDGGAGSTSFVDAKGKTVTAYGNVAQSAAAMRFGASSAYFDGSGDYLIVSGVATTALSGDFTVEFWYRPASISSSDRALLHINAGAINGLHIHHNLQTLIVDNGATATTASGSVFTSANTWYHVAVCKSGATLRAFVNGALALTHVAQSYGSPTRMVIGRYSDGSVIGDCNGYIDDLRFSTEGLYAANFSIPVERYPDA